MAAYCMVKIFYFCTVIFVFFFPTNNVFCNDLNLGNLAEIFSTLAGGDGCKFRCPKEHKPKLNEEHIPKSNGCGSYGIKFDTSEHPGFVECCNKHDICYDTCNSERSTCDKDFKECLQDSCHHNTILQKHSRKKHSECKGVADVMYAGTMGLGCGSFLEAQRNACLCNGKTISKKKMQKVQESIEL